MYKKAIPYFLKVVSPLHMGVGQDVGIVDLPIQRDRATGYPKIDGSGLKGAIRDHLEAKFWNGEESLKNRLKVHLLFGLDDQDEEVKKKLEIKSDNLEYASTVSISDASILFFSVKSIKGVYSLITSVDVLKTFFEKLGLVLDKSFEVEQILNSMSIGVGECIVLENSLVRIKNNVILEEYLFYVKDNLRDKFSKIIDELSRFYNDLDRSRVVLLSDDDFRSFVEMSTEVITRTKIDNKTGTVKSGALFTEEYLPAQTVMYFFFFYSDFFFKRFKIDEFKDVDDAVRFVDENLGNFLQIGGNATIGKGLVKLHKGVENG